MGRGTSLQISACRTDSGEILLLEADLAVQKEAGGRRQEAGRRGREGFSLRMGYFLDWQLPEEGIRNQESGRRGQ